MAKHSRGFMEISDPDSTSPNDTVTCQHCNKVTKLRPFCDPADIEFGGQCKGCMGMICTTCYGRGGCDTIEAKLDRQERYGRSQAGRDAIEQAIERQRAVASYR